MIEINGTKRSDEVLKILEKRCGGKYVETLTKHNATCTSCDSTRNIVVHHVDGNPKNNKDENLTVLCRRCHDRLHYWGVFKHPFADMIIGLRSLGLTLKETGRLVGLSHQRISQIEKSYLTLS